MFPRFRYNREESTGLYRLQTIRKRTFSLLISVPDPKHAASGLRIRIRIHPTRWRLRCKTKFFKFFNGTGKV
jgi:hypothetical protein